MRIKRLGRRHFHVNLNNAVCNLSLRVEKPNARAQELEPDKVVADQALYAVQGVTAPAQGGQENASKVRLKTLSVRKMGCS